MKKIWQNKWKRLALIIALLLIIIGAVVLVLVLTDKGTKVEVAKVEKADIEQRYDTTGTLTSSSTEKYYALEGFVPKTVKVEPGDVVCKGDILATFDTSVMNSTINEYYQSYVEAQEAYNSALESYNEAEKTDSPIKDQLKSIVDSNKSQMDSAKNIYDALVKEKAEYDKGIVAKANGKVTDVYIKEGVSYVAVSDSSDSTGLTDIMGGSVNVSGILSEFSNQSQTGLSRGLAMVVDYYEGYTIGFTLGKYDVQTIKKGMTADITYTDFEYEGVVSYISATANSTTDIVSSMMGGSSTTTTSSVPAQITITNPDENLIVGFDAKVSILVDTKEDVLSIPVEALFIEEEKTYVYVIEDGKAKKKEISVGISSDTRYELKKGLKKDQEVILNASKIKEGQKVYVG